MKLELEKLLGKPEVKKPVIQDTVKVLFVPDGTIMTDVPQTNILSFNSVSTGVKIDTDVQIKDWKFDDVTGTFVKVKP